MPDSSFLEESYWNGLIKMSLSKLFILWALTEGPLHGYAISKKINEVTQGCCGPTEGSLYPALNQFESEDYLTSKYQLFSGRQRKVYSLTEKGFQAYGVGVNSWQHTAEILVKMNDKLPLPGGKDHD